MFKRAFLALIMAYTMPVAGFAALASESDRPDTITILSKATIEVPPDIFIVSGNIFERAGSREAALQAASDTLETLKDEMRRLEGLEFARLNSDSAQIDPAYERGCETMARDERPREICEPVAYSVRIGLEMKAAPASEAGDAISLMTELGAKGARVDRYDLSDRESARRQALETAFEAARDQAEALAEATGRRLGEVHSVRYSDPQVFFQEQPFLRSDEVVVTGSRVRRPEVSLELEAAPTELSEQIQVVFKLLD